MIYASHFTIERDDYKQRETIPIYNQGKEVSNQQNRLTQIRMKIV